MLARKQPMRAVFFYPCRALKDFFSSIGVRASATPSGGKVMTKTANPSRVLLQIRDLTKSYRLGNNVVPVLRGLSLEVSMGEMVVIMGPSGSGKTTLLNCVAGIDVPDGGQVALDGEVMDLGSESARTRLRRRGIGMVFQFFNLIPTLTARENVALPFFIAGDTVVRQTSGWSNFSSRSAWSAGGSLPVSALRWRDAANFDRARSSAPAGLVTCR